MNKQERRRTSLGAVQESAEERTEMYKWYIEGAPQEVTQ